MIVKMSKIYIASGSDDRDRLLGALCDLGVVHLIPVDADSANPDEKTIHKLNEMDHAIQILSAEHHAAAGDAPDVSASEAAAETLHIHRASIERHNRLAALHRQVEHLAIWGDVRLEDIEALKQAGVAPDFYSVPAEDLPEIQAELVHTITELHDKRLLVAIVQRGEQAPQLPDSAEIIEIPNRDRPTVLSEAAEIDAALKADVKRLRELAHLLPTMHTEHNELRDQAQYTIAQRGGLHEGQLFAMQGWVPTDQVETLGQHITDAGITCAVQPLEPTEDEEPPSLVRYPCWARPIEALFKILNTTPGYRESELSPFFMIAMPIFTAMLIGDAGYGAIFILIALLFRGKIKSLAGKPAADLVLVFGLATVIWGLLTANIFGVSPDVLQTSVFWKPVGDAMMTIGVLWRADAEVGRNIIIKICFTMGCIHLVLAHLCLFFALAPNLKCLSEAGWCVFLVGMLGVIWTLFFKDSPLMSWTMIEVIMIAGGALVLLFSYPSRNPIKMLGLGLVSNLMPAIGTFSDTMSYIRLMAVGMASYYIASAFNGLAWQVGKVSPVLIIASALILLAAHALNIILCLIAIFAHGVRLNMLEFSNNAGVQWVGTPYAPFAAERISN